MEMQELQNVDQAVVVRDIEDVEDEAIFDEYLKNADSIDSQRENVFKNFFESLQKKLNKKKVSWAKEEEIIPPPSWDKRVTWAEELVEVTKIPTREDLKASGAFDRMFHKKK